MRIVVLDGYTATQNDLSWKSIVSLGEVTVFDRTCPEDIVCRCQDAEAVLTNKVVMSEDVNSVAQMVFAHVLNATMRVGHYADENRKGRWSRSDDFCWMDTPVTELYGKALGVVGLGNIGSTVARIADALLSSYKRNA